MASATKFIDFFVQDILDYTILNNDENNFIKNITIFNIQMAVDEITDILNDKVQMKEININIELVGFKNYQGCEEVNYLIKSD